MSPIHAIGAVTRSSAAPFEIVDLVLDEPRDDEVLIRVTASGICHTDLSVQRQVTPFPLPALLGHEGAGVVERVGSAVRDLAEGDRVVVSFNFCGRCRYCVSGRPVLCETWVPRNLLGGSRPDGTYPVRMKDGSPLHSHFFGQSSFATRMLVHETAAVKVRDDAPLALLAPLVCGVQTGVATVLQILAPRLGDTTVIFGAGAVGLSALLGARLTPSAQVIVVDVVPKRLQLAKELGADVTIDSRLIDPVTAIRYVTSGLGADRVLESSGRTAVLRQAIDASGIDATVAIVGAPALGSEVAFDVPAAIVKGPRIVGVNQGRSVPRIVIPALVDLFMSGRLPLDRLVRTYSFENINRAAQDMHSGETVKPVLLLPS